jgi:cytidylate kinase
MIITIDGPVGSGKSSVAKALAEKLDIYYLYTGLLYRAVAYIWFTKLGKIEEDLKNVSPQDLEFISKISYEYVGSDPQVLFEEENITVYLRDSSLAQQASIISAKQEVRKRLLELQQNVAKKYNLIADGRDCGSVVFPNADYKFFLTASVEQRAKRVMLDEHRGEQINNLEKVKAELEQRDKRDRERKISPLTVPDGGMIIDNSEMSKEETIEKILSFIKIEKE